MQEIQSILKNLLLVAQFSAILIGFIYILKLKKSHWKWFPIYLILIFSQEYFVFGNSSIEYQSKLTYAIFVGVPLEYMFLYWLYAFKSLKNKKLFIISVLTYIVSLSIFAFFKELNEVYPLSANVGIIILTGLIILEFVKQIKNDDILKFHTNKMFYVNLGLILFYIGTYPYHAFGSELYANHLKIWNIYNIYFLFANCIMYLLFSASFIWGKTQ